MMRMDRQHIAVLTDKPPTVPGANLVAWKFALEASKFFKVSFLIGSPVPNSTILRQASFDVFYIESERRVDRLISKLFYHLGLYGCIKVFKVLRFAQINKISAIWVHQIGIEIPLIVLSVLRVFGFPTVMTLHDFTLLSKHKLYPDDLSWKNERFQCLSAEITCGSIKARLRPFKYRARARINRLITSGAMIVPISILQRNIFTALGFKLEAAIPNGVDPCKCKGFLNREPNSVLFAGRQIGKGLERVFKLLECNPRLVLHLAGPKELELMARKRISQNRYTYHGFLSHRDLLLLIHQVSYVAVLSSCYDVFPSIVLEAIEHGAIPICSTTVGNQHLGVILPSITEQEFDNFATSLSSVPNPRYSGGKNLSQGRTFSFQESFKSYKTIFDNFLT